MSGQLALGMSETVVPAAVWETLPPASQQAIAVALARLRPPVVGRRVMSRFCADLVADRSAVAGELGWIVVDLVDQEVQGAGDAGGVRRVDRDGDPGWGVVDLSGLVQEVAGDRAVFVGVSEVGVDRAGEVKLGVVGQQS